MSHTGSVGGGGTVDPNPNYYLTVYHKLNTINHVLNTKNKVQLTNGETGPYLLIEAILRAKSNGDQLETHPSFYLRGLETIRRGHRDVAEDFLKELGRHIDYFSIPCKWPLSDEGIPESIVAFKKNGLELKIAVICGETYAVNEGHIVVYHNLFRNGPNGRFNGSFGMVPKKYERILELMLEDLGGLEPYSGMGIELMDADELKHQQIKNKSHVTLS